MKYTCIAEGILLDVVCSKRKSFNCTSVPPPTKFGPEILSQLFQGPGLTNEDLAVGDILHLHHAGHIQQVHPASLSSFRCAAAMTYRTPNPQNKISELLRRQCPEKSSAPSVLTNYPPPPFPLLHCKPIRPMNGNSCQTTKEPRQS